VQTSVQDCSFQRPEGHQGLRSQEIFRQVLKSPTFVRRRGCNSAQGGVRESVDALNFEKKKIAKKWQNKKKEKKEKK